MKTYHKHADDFGISVHASQNIISLIKEKLLDGISILPNMPCFEECVDLLHTLTNATQPFLNVSVHLNFMEGHCCADTSFVPDLVDAKGYFKVTWGSLLLASYQPGKKQLLKEQLKLEIKAQIQKILTIMPSSYQLSIDSHQHTHMIPIVWQALKEVIQEESYQVAFIRLSKEPFSPFMKIPAFYTSYGLANIIKNILLNWYSISIKKDMHKMHISYALLWGLMMSGNMNYSRIEKLYPYMKHYIEKRHEAIEILFHPGSVLPEEITEANVKPGFVEFHLSPNRAIENKSVRTLTVLF